ncbi:hypothetical protein B4U80_11568 [Leptotrombidium deliense]|uniref:S-adenosylmethionine mitochondrial carrier protein-like protein n=1 Tax=Leptotrombidium deliense TaxID=299467 RepID=A0A443SSW2_9ACAR|nr:hypothetical protein B4U80_11568 [Leptotrombidium deliense]
METNVKQYNYVKFLAGGAFAGLVVDLSLFPLDTIKTRLQSELGFWKSGGFRNVYSGLGSVAVGSAPNAALFFVTYESMKIVLSKQVQLNDRTAQMAAASCGEAVACLIRVPTEVVKQRSQTSKLSSLENLRVTVKSEGIPGLYRGYVTTLCREIPFSFIQFPLWEALKDFWSQKQGKRVNPMQATICGAIAGGTAAFITTPLDVAKTRVMLAKKNSLHASANFVTVLRAVYKTSGIRGCFAGVAPRVLWISIGGALFLGSYDTK